MLDKSSTSLNIIPSPNNENPKHAKKWNHIISCFMDNRMDELREIQRSGTRGRIFAYLCKRMYSILEIEFIEEPVFEKLQPEEWYRSFADKHNIKLKEYPTYNPDLLLQDGTWVEFTLSENTAYKKIFKYGHQTKKLKLLWIDEDSGYHKSVCENVTFPDSCCIQSIEHYFPILRNHSKGENLTNHFIRLKGCKGIIR